MGERRGPQNRNFLVRMSTYRVLKNKEHSVTIIFWKTVLQALLKLKNQRELFTKKVGNLQN